MSREITDAEIEFVSLVNRAANKRKFLIAKQAERKNKMTEIRKGTSAKEAKQILTDRIVETICNFVEEAEKAGVAINLDGLEVSAKNVEKSSGEHYLHGLL